MKQPWLEVWTLIDERLSPTDYWKDITVETEDEEVVSLAGPSHSLPATEIRAARARLIAAAPELVRALLAVEWVRMPDRPYPKCPACDADEPDADHPWWTHTNECEIDVALRKAGLPDQASRDEARRSSRT